MPDRQLLEADGGQGPVIEPGHTFATVTDKISSVVLTRRTPVFWFAVLSVSFLLVMLLLFGVTVLFARGVGVWGINIPVAWGFAIINFVWWIGIGHAGTLISAILLLLNQKLAQLDQPLRRGHDALRRGLRRLLPHPAPGPPVAVLLADAIPEHHEHLAAVPQPAGLGRLRHLHLRHVSLLFWFVGLLPDLATLRDRARQFRGQAVLRHLAMGWRGSARHWHRYDHGFSAAGRPGHAAGGVGSHGGELRLRRSHPARLAFHDLSALLRGRRHLFGLRHGAWCSPSRCAPSTDCRAYITMRHLDNSAKVMLATGLLVAYSYLTEIFMAWYSGSPFEQFVIWNRMTGPYAPGFWALILCNLVIPQLLWIRKVRLNTVALFFIAVVVLVGMWLERYVIIVTSLHRDFLPTSWGMYYPTAIDWMIYLGTIGLFLFLFFMFIRLLPMISIFEVRTLLPEARVREEA
jgi:hypothetical protein